MKFPFKKQRYQLRDTCSKLIHAKEITNCKATMYPYISHMINCTIREGEQTEAEGALQEFGQSGWKDIEEYKTYRRAFRNLFLKCMGQGNSDQWLIIFAMKDKITFRENKELSEAIADWESSERDLINGER